MYIDICLKMLHTGKASVGLHGGERSYIYRQMLLSHLINELSHISVDCFSSLESILCIGLILLYTNSVSVFEYELTKFESIPKFVLKLL